MKGTSIALEVRYSKVDLGAINPFNYPEFGFKRGKKGQNKLYLCALGARMCTL